MSFRWQTGAAAGRGSTAGAEAASGVRARSWLDALGRGGVRRVALRLPRPELLGVMALAAVVDLWALARNGWANEYYAAAVRSMSASWHDFLFASLDRGGLMTVDKPPLALWVQALSVRLFGFHSLSILVPQALMGVASVALLYDLVRRRFGRLAGFIAALTLALTPITVAISRHNNPDALLVLCCIAALWCAVRGLEHGRTRWLVAAGVCVGLGFETKMLVALVVVPGIAAAWLWLAPGSRAAAAAARTPKAGGRLRALRQLLWGGLAMLVVGGAWPLLVELTPAADRPWVSGTSDDRILSLIFGYNGLGRVDGQSGGPGGTASNLFGGATGPFRLLNSALGGQAGWLLGFALVSALVLLASTRLRRSDARSGWLLLVGGAFASTALLFSFAGGIFHPYYVSLLAPFTAALVGAGSAQLRSAAGRARLLAPVAVLAGIAVELVVLADYPGQLTWLAPGLIVVGALAALALLAFGRRSARLIATVALLAALLTAPAVWAFDTIGHATSSTFPAGGPVSAQTGGPGGFGARGGPGGPGGSGGPGARFLRSGPNSGQGAAGPQGGVGIPQLFGSSGQTGPPTSGGRAFGFGGGLGGPGGAAGSPMGGGVSSSVLSYVRAHGGGAIAVSSQSSAASAILRDGADVAGIGGFSGRESEVSMAWLASEVRSGKIRWVLDDEGGTDTRSAGGLGAGTFGAPGQNRVGARKAMAAVAKACSAVKISSAASTASGTLYDCAGRAGAVEALAAREART